MITAAASNITTNMTDITSADINDDDNNDIYYYCRFCHQHHQYSVLINIYTKSSNGLAEDIPCGCGVCIIQAEYHL